jgi:hypothetical protein
MQVKLFEPIERADFTAISNQRSKTKSISTAQCFHTVTCQGESNGRSVAIREHMVKCCNMHLRSYTRKPQEAADEESKVRFLMYSPHILSVLNFRANPKEQAFNVRSWYPLPRRALKNETWNWPFM